VSTPTVIWVAVVGAAALAFVLAAYVRRWEWAGFAGSRDTDRAPKTLWDWLQLLIVPLVLALAAFALNAAQTDRDRRQEERRAARDRLSAEDRAREDTLRTYLQQMSDLITRHGLQSTRQGRATANTQALARTLTLIALRRLDGTRKGLVVQFLQEADLINSTAVWEKTPRGLQRNRLLSSGPPKVSLHGADLRGAVMPSSGLTSFADFGGPGGRYRTRAAVLDGADLRHADFHGTSLLGVTLVWADLRGANFSGAALGGTFFESACLSGARFVRASGGDPPADFSFSEGRGVDFSNARLNNTSFRRARLTDVKLSGASTTDAMWPRGWTPTGVRMSHAKARRLCSNVSR
jgi:uncharacterized protein YjbI with pentapeptide repeats